MQPEHASRTWHLPFPGFAAGVALTTALALLLCRVLILWPQIDAASPLKTALLVAGATAQDWLLVAGLYGLAIVLWFATGEGRAMAGRIILTAVLLAITLAGLGNVAAVAMLDGPLTLDWLSFADVTKSSYMIDGIAQEVTPRRILLGILGLTLYAALSYSLAFVVVHLAENGKAAILSGIGTLCGFAICAALGLNFQPVASGQSSNAVLAFAASVIGSSPQGRGINAAFAAPTGTVVDKASFAGVATDAIPRPDTTAVPIHNVLIFVMESTSARIVTGYDGTYSVTPNFARYVDEMGLQVSDAYAHAPASGMSLASIAGGLEPDLWSASMTEGRDDIVVDGLASLLAAQGMRTGFFDSNDKRFQNVEGFAKRAGFETVQDSRDWSCDLGGVDYDDSSGEYLDKKHDICTARVVNAWIDQVDGKPFFAMLWTGMTHYPYFPGTNDTVYTDDPDLNAYLNAAFSGDQALAETVEHLRMRGLLDETLIVVVGDHGEAFGEHGQYGHATGLWEENTRVPMAFLNPRLFPKGERVKLIAALDDVAPTIADLMGIAPPAGWSGSSIFAEDRSTGVFLFAPWGGFRTGFRDGDRKYIFNANTSEEYLYDLANDPTEQENLALTDPAAARHARDDLSKWIAWQSAYRSQTAGTAPSTPTSASTGSEVVIMATGTSYLSAPAARVLIDGKEVGRFEVTDALKNDTAAVDDDTIRAAFKEYRLPIDPVTCPRVLEIEFLNDEWEGEGQTGDTDLFIDKVSFAGLTYSPNRYRLITPSAGFDYWGSYRMTRNGSVAIDLALDRACLTAEVAAP